MSTFSMMSPNPLAAEPIIPATASEANDARQTSLAQILREGLLAIAVAFALTAPASVLLGESHAARQSVIIEGFVVMLVGMLAAKTLAGRVFLSMTYLFFYENNYFSPVSVWIFSLTPSTFLVIVAIVLESLRSRPRTLLTKGAEHLRLPLFMMTAALSIAWLVAASFSPAGLVQGLNVTLRMYVPILLFAAAGAAILRRGEAGILLDLIPFLAAFAAATVWIYTLTGERVLYYSDVWTYHERIGRFGGLLRNPNSTSCLCVASILIILIRLHRAPFYLRLVMLANALYLGGTAAVERTRGALVVLGLLLPCLLANRRARAPVLLFLVIGALGVVPAGQLLTASQSEETSQESVVDRFRTIDEGLYLRLQSFADALGTLAHNPFGVGPVGGVLSDDIESATGLEAHNEYVGFITRNGFEGIFPLVLLIGLIVAGWVSAARHRMPHRPGTVLKALMAAFLITFNFEPILANSYELSAVFGLVTGMCTASVLFAQAQTETTLTVPHPPRARSAPAIAAPPHWPYSAARGDTGRP